VEGRRPHELALSEHLEVFLALLLGNTNKAGAMHLVDEAGTYKTRLR
jgi:hypothetical protein